MTRRLPLFVLTATLALTLPVAAQLTQTLPRGFEAVDGSSSTSYPFNNLNDHIWQWHYDSSDFDLQDPIIISELSVRASQASATVGAWSFAQFEVTMIAASTDWTDASHDTVFANNVFRGQVVRSGAFTGGSVPPSGGTTSTWIPLELAIPFIYDPSSGQDLIVQVRKCGTTTSFGTAIDAVIGSPLCGRYGDLLNCNATNDSYRQQGVVPILKVDYTLAMQTLPQGFEATAGSAATSNPFQSSSDQVWQWHYDSSQFAVQQPIEINEISVRPESGFGLSAFDYTSVEIALIEAGTDYVAASHDPIFANNEIRRKVVRTGPFIGGPVAPSGGTVEPFFALGLQDSFTYDPTTGNDLIIEIRICGVVSAWGTRIEGQVGSIGGVGGNRYGHRTDCTALTEDFRNNEFVPIVMIDFKDAACNAAINTFPYFEDFDSVTINGTTTPPLGWEQDENDASGSVTDWLFRNTATSSTGTGPTADSSTAQPGDGYYAYAEDSGAEHVAVNLLSPCFDLAGVDHPVLCFRLHSNNVNGLAGPFATLSVDLIGEQAEYQDVLIANHTGDAWLKVAINLAPYAAEPFRVRFRVRNDNGTFVHDIAIDDVYVGPGGTRDDLALETEVQLNRRFDDPEKSAAGGDFVRWILDSPNANLWGQSPVLLGQVFTDGPFPIANAIPELYMTVGADPIFILFDAGAIGTPFGPVVLGPGGLSILAQIPPGFAAFTIVTQGLVSSPVVNNGIYALTVPHYLDLQ